VAVKVVFVSVVVSVTVRVAVVNVTAVKILGITPVLNVVEVVYVFVLLSSASTSALFAASSADCRSSVSESVLVKLVEPVVILVDVTDSVVAVVMLAVVDVTEIVVLLTVEEVIVTEVVVVIVAVGVVVVIVVLLTVKVVTVTVVVVVIVAVDVVVVAVEVVVKVLAVLVALVVDVVNPIGSMSTYIVGFTVELSMLLESSAHPQRRLPLNWWTAIPMSVSH
jgi:hypothetical protein